MFILLLTCARDVLAGHEIGFIREGFCVGEGTRDSDANGPNEVIMKKD